MRVRRGISNIIGTVVILAVAISIAVIVVFWEIVIAFWMTGSTGLSMKCERLVINDAYADWSSEYSTWVVVLHLVNDGSSDITISDLLINGRSLSSWVGLGNHSVGYVFGRVVVTSGDLLNNTGVGGVGFYAYGSNSWNVTLDDAYPIVPNGFKVLNLDYGLVLKVGRNLTLVILMPGPGASRFGAVEVPFKHGSSIEVEVLTAIGREYPVGVGLP